ncbi:MAG TPA: type VI secretion system ATPase TssH, partial [Firmicutes bacterium]|nr:type VI secretion system ATPase TssH [Bacillota bacterium]
LCKAIAEAMFDDENNIIRIDMSEYMEKYSTSRLIGAPPGYVGYEEGGQLTEKVRRNPYCIVLFDEIEKAHPEVFNLLLQILDDGHITDSQGRLVDFKNTIIIMTSNLGSDLLLRGKKDEVNALLHHTFRPEFLNRIDEIVYFNPLSKDVQYKVVEKMLNILNNRLKENYYSFEFTDALKNYILDSAYSYEFGARPIKRFIQNNIETIIARAIIDGTVDTKHKFKVDYKDNKVVLSKI